MTGPEDRIKLKYRQPKEAKRIGFRCKWERRHHRPEHKRYRKWAQAHPKSRC